MGFTIRFPEFAVLVSLVCWGSTPSVVVFCGFCQVVIPQVVGSLMLGEVVLLGFVSYLASKRLYRIKMVELMSRSMFLAYLATITVFYLVKYCRKHQHPSPICLY